MLGALPYVLQSKKVTFDGVRVETGHNCTPYTSYLEMMATKQYFKKTDGVNFFHYVHSFSDKENITPWQANEIARELAERLFPNNEYVLGTGVLRRLRKDAGAPPGAYDKGDAE